MSNWGTEVNAAVRQSKIEIVGQADIKNQAQANVVTSIINVYGDSAAGFIYIEPRTARSTERPPDVLLCHPDVGLLFIEVKGDTIENIQGLVGGKLLLRRNGYNVPQDPITQAENAMFDVENSIKRNLGRRTGLPLLNVMASFPNISESDWTAKGYDRTFPNEQLLFKETLEHPQRLKQRVGQWVKKTLQESGKTTPLTAEHISAIKIVFGDSATINERRPPRAWVDERKLGAYIDEMAALEKYLSSEQQELSRLGIDSHPRLIRGVAGSGKSVVLANLVARYVNRNKYQQEEMFNQNRQKELNVGVICFNRSLVSFLNKKIRDAYKQQTLTDLPPNTVDVTHYNGLMWRLSEQTPIKYIKVGSADAAAIANQYRTQLAGFAKSNPDWYQSLLYDAIFIDEGQDLTPEDYQVLLDLIKVDPKTNEKALIIFYDDAQNLYARIRPNWKQIGIDVQRGDRARVMRECFRNTREIVELAFNVLLGTQAIDRQNVQTRTFADVNNLKKLGLVEELGDHFKVRFADRTFNKPEIREYNSRNEEKEWIAEEIVRLVEEEEVRPEDILVLFHHSADFQDLPDIINRRSTKNGIKGFLRPYNAGKREDQDQYIFRENHLTISTTYGAKGYDAQIVFLVGSDLFETDEKGRASFYVGATRSKMMLYLSGKKSSNSLLTEAQKVNQVC